MRYTFAFFAAALALAYLVYSPALHGGFIMDDWGYLVQNPWITQTGSPWLFWARLDQPDYWPLTYTCYWLMYRLFGTEPFGYHAVNVALHAFNATLVYALATRFRTRGAWLAGAVFLLHPLGVQAVAWITQFKTLLATALALGSALAYTRFLREDRVPAYFAALASFALALLAKTSVVTFALIVPLLPFATGKLGRLKAWPFALPFLALALVSAYLTLTVNARNGFALHGDWSLPARTAWFYIRTFFLPYPLAYVHDLPALTMGALLGLTLAAGTLFTHARWAMLAYALALAPALGFLNVPGMKLTPVAEHWAYWPNAFLAIAVAVLVNAAKDKRVRAFVSLICLPFAYLTLAHAKNFRDEEAFWSRSLAVAGAKPTITYNLGVTYDRAGRVPEALARYQQTVLNDPNHARAWGNLGRLLFNQGARDEATEAFMRSVALDPRQPGVYANLVQALMARNKREDARRALQAGRAANPEDSTLANMERGFPR